MMTKPRSFANIVWLCAVLSSMMGIPHSLLLDGSLYDRLTLIAASLERVAQKGALQSNLSSYIVS